MSGLAEDTGLAVELCQIERGLSRWEVDFVESIARQVIDERRPLTSEQERKAREILARKGKR